MARMSSGQLCESGGPCRALQIGWPGRCSSRRLFDLQGRLLIGGSRVKRQYDAAVGRGSSGGL